MFVMFAVMVATQVVEESVVVVVVRQLENIRTVLEAKE